VEWNAPGIIVSAVPFGEGDALASIFTEAYGVFRGLARGGLSRARASTWQVGNLVEARWIARLSDQLGSFTSELVHPAAALAMDDALSLAILQSACAVAEGALPEREPHGRVFGGLLHLIAHLAPGEASLAEYVQWEAGLLADLGFALDLSVCAVTGTASDLAFVSPKTGRAVCGAAAGIWRDRLLPLPAFLTREVPADPAALSDGLRLTGHFLARDAFGARHRPLPAARLMLADRVGASLLGGRRSP
jgi:DNA repair protein RecO (recombination protein O)